MVSNPIQQHFCKVGVGGHKQDTSVTHVVLALFCEALKKLKVVFVSPLINLKVIISRVLICASSSVL